MVSCVTVMDIVLFIILLIIFGFIGGSIGYAVVYCDPPYKGTTGYTTSKNFNHKEFWEYMRELSKTHKVFISEESAPDDFECIWSKEIRRTLNSNQSNRPKKTEKLFVWKGK